MAPDADETTKTTDSAVGVLTAVEAEKPSTGIEINHMVWGDMLSLCDAACNTHLIPLLNSVGLGCLELSHNF